MQGEKIEGEKSKGKKREARTGMRNGTSAKTVVQTDITHTREMGDRKGGRTEEREEEEPVVLAVFWFLLLFLAETQRKSEGWKQWKMRQTLFTSVCMCVRGMCSKYVEKRHMCVCARACCVYVPVVFAALWLTTVTEGRATYGRGEIGTFWVVSSGAGQMCEHVWCGWATQTW